MQEFCIGVIEMPAKFSVHQVCPLKRAGRRGGFEDENSHSFLTFDPSRGVGVGDPKLVDADFCTSQFL